MKSERRHELQHNELSDHMGVMAERVRPYTAGIAISVIAILVALGLYSFWKGQQRVQNAEAWEAYYAATQTLSPDMAKLEDVAKKFPRDNVGLWASIMLADYQLADGAQELFSDRAKANENLAKAVVNYNHVLENTREDVLRERADIGLARAYEAQGELEKARQRYQVLILDSAGSPFALLARERLDHLELAQTKEFYDWFGKQDPKPSATAAPATGDPVDFDFSKLPEAPPSKGDSMLQLPGFPLEGAPGTTEGAIPADGAKLPETAPAAGEVKAGADVQPASPSDAVAPGAVAAPPAETPPAAAPTPTEQPPATEAPPAELPPSTEAPAAPH